MQQTRRYTAPKKYDQCDMSLMDVMVVTYFAQLLLGQCLMKTYYRM